MCHLCRVLSQLQRPGIKTVLFPVRLFECHDASGEGEFVTSPADHLQFVSANQRCVVDFHTFWLRGTGCGHCELCDVLVVFAC
jgi:hypothetical protein